MKTIVSSPCTESWDQMIGTESARFCSRCEKHVHNLSCLSDSEARALVNRGTSVCVKFYSHPDGSVMTAESGSKVFIERRTFVRTIAAGFAGALLPIFGQEAARDNELLFRGTIVDESNKAILSSTVAVKQRGKTIRKSRVDANGEFSIPSLKPGTYMISVSARGFAPASKEIELKEGSEIRSIFVLQRAKTVIVGEVSPP